MKTKDRDERELSPRERADAARRRIREAAASMGTPAGKVRDRTRQDPFSSMGLALLAGFLIGYSPELRQMFVSNASGIVQAILRKW